MSKLKEEWTDIIGYEGHYKISNYGEVKSIKFNKEKILKPKENKGGYFEYELRKPKEKSKTISAHRLVAIHFLDNQFNLPVVNHIDGDKHNNNVNNLEWCDYSHNNKHAYDNDLNHKRNILQYDLNGKFINKFHGINYACEQLGLKKTQASNIIKCCKGEIKQASGYIWRYSYRGFEEVREEMRKTEGAIILPTRGSKTSAGYDFYSTESFILKPQESKLVWSDVKAYMQEGEVLELYVRSSIGIKKSLTLKNFTGIIDSDYYYG